jgi:hypothetical protein
VKGIEPSSSAWKAVALPLSYTRGWESTKDRISKSETSPTSRFPSRYFLSNFDIRISNFPNGGCRIRTCEGISHQIYSLTPLATRETHRVFSPHCSKKRTAGVEGPSALTTHTLGCDKALGVAVAPFISQKDAARLQPHSTRLFANRANRPSYPWNCSKTGRCAALAESPNPCDDAQLAKRGASHETHSFGES